MTRNTVCIRAKTIRKRRSSDLEIRFYIYITYMCVVQKNKLEQVSNLGRKPSSQLGRLLFSYIQSRLILSSICYVPVKYPVSVLGSSAILQPPINNKHLRVERQD